MSEQSVRERSAGDARRQNYRSATVGANSTTRHSPTPNLPPVTPRPSGVTPPRQHDASEASGYGKRRQPPVVESVKEKSIWAKAAPAGRWFFQGSDNPAPVRRQRPAHYVAPAERAIYIFFGAGLMMFSTFLTALFIQAQFPAFSGKDLSWQSMVAGTAASAVFMADELYIWRGHHSPVVWVLLLGIMSLDITMNIGGCASLFGVPNLAMWPLTNQVIFILTVGAAVALLPEKLLSTGFGR